VTKAVSVDEKDVIAFRKLAELGVELDLRVVATDTKGDFEAKLKEASF
jgi:PTS system sorbose-specific IIB component